MSDTLAVAVTLVVFAVSVFFLRLDAQKDRDYAWEALILSALVAIAAGFLCELTTVPDFTVVVTLVVFAASAFFLRHWFNGLPWPWHTNSTIALSRIELISRNCFSQYRGPGRAWSRESLDGIFTDPSYKDYEGRKVATRFSSVPSWKFFDAGGECIGHQRNGPFGRSSKSTVTIGESVYTMRYTPQTNLVEEVRGSGGRELLPVIPSYLYQSGPNLVRFIDGPEAWLHLTNVHCGAERPLWSLFRSARGALFWQRVGHPPHLPADEVARGLGEDLLRSGQLEHVNATSTCGTGCLGL